MLDFEDVARTYDPPGYDDPVDLVHDFYRVRGYHNAHPDLGKVKLGRRFPDVSSDRIHNWIHDSRPAVVKGLDGIEARGWFDTFPHRVAGKALCVLVVGTYACGSLASETLLPRWFPSHDDTTDELLAALDDAEIEANIDREGDGAELWVSDGHLIGRSLAALGCPVGQKSTDTVDPFPAFVFDAPDETRQTCARLFVRERGSSPGTEETIQLLLTKRSEQFIDSVIALLESVTDEPITRGETVTVSAAAARDLDITELT